MKETLTPMEWIIKGEVGISSKTIWSVMMGIEKVKQACDGWNYDVPHDPDDFSRCWKLLVAFPEWKPRLNEVAKVFPKWTGFIREWDKLCDMVRQWYIDSEIFVQKRAAYWKLAEDERIGIKEPVYEGHGMYEFMQSLEKEGMILDGWVQDSPGGWHRPTK